MLNVYKIFERPETLPLYNEIAHKFDLFRSPRDWNPSMVSELEPVKPIITRTPGLAFPYAAYVLQGRFPAGEPFIIRDAEMACYYAKDVLKRRWADVGLPEAEETIAKDPVMAFDYAEHVLQGRFKQAEPYMLKDIESATYYAMNLLNKRWPAYEKEMHKILADEDYYNDETGMDHEMVSDLWDEYAEHFGIDE